MLRSSQRSMRSRGSAWGQESLCWRGSRVIDRSRLMVDLFGAQAGKFPRRTPRSRGPARSLLLVWVCCSRTDTSSTELANFLNYFHAAPLNLIRPIPAFADGQITRMIGRIRLRYLANFGEAGPDRAKIGQIIDEFRAPFALHRRSQEVAPLLVASRALTRDHASGTAKRRRSARNRVCARPRGTRSPRITLRACKTPRSPCPGPVSTLSTTLRCCTK